MSEKRLWTKPVIAGALAVFGLVTTASLAQAEQMGRDPWNFKVLDNPLALNRAIAIEKQEEDGFNKHLRMLMTYQLPQPQTDCWPVNKLSTENVKL